MGKVTNQVKNKVSVERCFINGFLGQNLPIYDVVTTDSICFGNTDCPTLYFRYSDSP